MPSNQPKGVLSPERTTLTAAQRQEWIRLKARGVEDEVARALAQALAKSSVQAWLGTAPMKGPRNGVNKKAKPLGAAYAHGRKVAREKGGGQKKARAAAQAYLKREGHEPMAKGGPGSGPSKGGAATQEVSHAATSRSLATLRQSAKDARARGDHAQADRIAARIAGMASQELGSLKKAETREHADPKTKGAAFQYARRLNRQRGGNKKAERQIAEDYLTRRGHAPLTKAADDLELAQAALALNKKHFAPAFVAAARTQLQPHTFRSLHAQARSSAGGKASGAARRAASGSAASLKELQEEHAKLVAELAACEQALAEHPALAKSTAPEGVVHVDVPLALAPRKKKGGQKRRKNVLEKDAPADALLAQAAFLNPAIEQDQRLIDAARLVAGMDWELFVGASDAEDARSRASRQLAQDRAYYDNKLQRDDHVRGLHGIDVDLGGGQARAPGHLSLDLYPYDHGTAVADLGLGIPLGDSSCRALRLVNALQYMPDFAEDATPLLLEAQRVLTYGGRLYYQGRGDLTAKADWGQLPGLVLIDHQDTRPVPGQEETASDLHAQTFERVRVRVPRIFGADPTWMGQVEDGPEDLAFAMAAMGGTAPASRAMEALLVKSEDPVEMRAEAPITQAEMYKKIVYSVVYAPNEMDFDGEYMEPEDIEKMAHDAYRNQIPIKVEHQGDPVGAHIVESYIAPADFIMKGQAGPQAVPKGAWVMAIQFTDDDQWQKVLSGEYRGVSVGGRALYENR